MGKLLSKRRLVVTLAVVLCLCLAFLGMDAYIKSTFSGYSKVSYRLTETDFAGFFGFIPRGDTMTIDMMER